MEPPPAGALKVGSLKDKKGKYLILVKHVHTLTDDIMTVDAYFGQFLDQSFRLVQAVQVDYRWHGTLALAYHS